MKESRKTKVLLIEDDRKLRRALELHLEAEGFEIVTASDGQKGLHQLYGEQPDLVVLDIMMPNMNGWQTCQRIREFCDVPVIMLTALGQGADRVRGLEGGADDYVVKPFDLHELTARIRAVLRRSPSHRPGERGVIFADDRLVIDSERWEVHVHGERVKLTATERRLLFLLAENAGRILPSSRILERVWGAEYVDSTHYLKPYIWRLRKKIEPNPDAPRYILTERGVGYRFARRVQVSPAHTRGSDPN